MKFPISRILCTLAGLAAVLGAQPTLADDSEVFTSSTFTTGVGARPNVLFIMDTSGSMDSEVTVYDPTKTYTGSCDAATSTGATANSNPSRRTAPPPRASSRWMQQPLPHLVHRHGGQWLVERRACSSSTSTGTRLGRPGRRCPDRKVECEGDSGNHGDTIASSTGKRQQSVRAQWQPAPHRWGSASSNNQVNWGAKPRVSFYSANYINWYFGGGEGVARDAPGDRQGRGHGHDQHPARA